MTNIIQKSHKNGIIVKAHHNSHLANCLFKKLLHGKYVTVLQVMPMGDEENLLIEYVLDENYN